MGLVKVIGPLTGMAEVLTEVQFSRLVEARTTKLLPAGPVGTPLPVQSGSLGLERRLALCQRLGKGWLPGSPRFPPLSGCRAEPLLEAPVAKRAKAAHPKVSIVSRLARPSFFRPPCIGGQNLSLEPVPPCLQWVMPILKGTGNTLLCSRFGYGKRISTRAKSVNSEHRHEWRLDKSAISRGLTFAITAAMGNFFEPVARLVQEWVGFWSAFEIGRAHV